MFTAQIGTLIQSLIGAGMPSDQANAMSPLGNCQAALQHNGPIRVDYEWPTNADPDNHAAMTLNTQGTALNIPLGDVRMGSDSTLYVDYISPVGGEPVPISQIGGAGVLADLTADLPVGSTSTASFVSWGGSSWGAYSPTTSVTVYDGELMSGAELIPSGTRVFLVREMLTNKWIVTQACAN